MRNIILITALLSCLPFLAQAQYPANPGKMRLGIQTTGQGLVFVTDTVPTWTPSNVANAWMALDTSANQLWCYANAAWGLCSGDGVDSLRFASDTLWVYQGGDSLGVEIIAGVSMTAGSGIEIVGDSINVNGQFTINDSGIFDSTETRTFSIGTMPYEKFWDDYAPGTAFKGFFYSPNYWGGTGVGNIQVDDDVYNRIEFFNDGTLFIGTEKFEPGTSSAAYIELSSNNSFTNRGQINLSGRIDANTYRYVLPFTSPSTTLNDTTIMAWRGLGSSAEPIGFIPKPTAGATVTASNGLTKTGDDIKLGGTLTESTTIAGGANNITITSSGTPIIGISTGSIGGGTFESRGASTNTYLTPLVVSRQTTATAAAGLGGRIAYNLELSSGSQTTAGYLGMKWADPTAGAHTTDFEIIMKNNAVDDTQLRLTGLGQLSLPKYTTNTFIGSGWGRLAVDASGVVVVDTTSAGGSGDPDQTLSLSGDTLTISGAGGNSVVLPAGVSGSGTVNTIPKFTAATAIGDSQLTDDGTLISAGGTAGLRLPQGTTAQRPTGAAGISRYNTTNGAMEYYGASDWEVPALSANATGKGTVNQIPFYDANGRLANNAIITKSTDGLKITHTTDAFATAGLVVQNTGSGSQSARTTWYGQSSSMFLGVTSETYPGFVDMGFILTGSDASGGQLLGTIGNSPLTLRTNSIDRARITGDGKMGIGNLAPQTTLHITGSFSRGAPVTKTADFTVAATENWLIVNNASAITTVTLPAASTNTGRELMLKNLSAVYTVISASSNVVPIDGTAAGTAILPATAGAWATLVSDGTNWIIMQQ
jgi:hypothetical protein